MVEEEPVGEERRVWRVVRIVGRVEGGVEGESYLARRFMARIPLGLVVVVVVSLVQGDEWSISDIILK